MWQNREEIIPIIVTSTVLVLKSLQKNLDKHLYRLPQEGSKSDNFYPLLNENWDVLKNNANNNNYV